MTAAITIRVPAARLLTRTERGGRGFKSRPLGASILGQIGFQLFRSRSISTFRAFFPLPRISSAFSKRRSTMYMSSLTR